MERASLAMKRNLRAVTRFEYGNRSRSQLLLVKRIVMHSCCRSVEQLTATESLKIT